MMIAVEAQGVFKFVWIVGGDMMMWIMIVDDDCG